MFIHVHPVVLRHGLISKGPHVKSQQLHKSAPSTPGRMVTAKMKLQSEGDES
jgi:hypothetical protein